MVLQALVASLLLASDASGLASRCSSFFGRASHHHIPPPVFADHQRRSSRHRCSTSSSRAMWTMFDSFEESAASSSPSFNAWSVLSRTEKWISETLANTNTGFNNNHGAPPSYPSPMQHPYQQSQQQSESESSTSSSNPYTRKEVEYACENAHDTLMITASVFRRLKEVREMGERHGTTQEELANNLGSSYDLRTFRKTQVVVIPGNPVLSTNFSVFDRWMEAINQARRNARDYVTDVALEKLNHRLQSSSSSSDVPHHNRRDWSVSVSCAHLHPRFGELNPTQQLELLKHENVVGEVDVNYQDYRERKLLARRSPYPTLVLEVRAVPPADFSASPPPLSLLQSSLASSSSSRRVSDRSSRNKGSISSDDIQRLEALFGKSPAFNHPTLDRASKEEEDDFYEKIGDSIQEFSAVTPLRRAQEWMASNDPEITSNAVFTESSTRHVDAAYEFIFTNIAMMKESHTTRQYLVLPHFLSSSATSFEKLTGEVMKLVQILPDVSGQVHICTFHPEHVEARQRSPIPVYVLTWKD